MQFRDFKPREFRASELYGDHWFNSPPVIVGSLRGRIILLHFWDYTCVSCERCTRYVRGWFDKYWEFGLSVVGVHTPRFPFGRRPEDVHDAVRRLGINYPVVTDNDSIIWSRYGVDEWPAMVLVDTQGSIRFLRSGEGNYAHVEQLIQSMLFEAGIREGLPDLTEPFRAEDRPGASMYRSTQQLSAGYLRGSLGNVEGVAPEATMAYSDPGIYFEGRLYLKGTWVNNRQSFLSVAGDEGGEIVVCYEGAEVHVVLTNEEKKLVTMEVIQDDRPLDQDNRGEDVEIQDDGSTVIQVNSSRRYFVVKNKESGGHVLRLRMHGGSCSLFGFTFVSGAISEVVTQP